VPERPASRDGGTRPRRSQLVHAGLAELGKLVKLCELDEATAPILTKAANRYDLSARTVHRVLRLARTIADLDGAERITKEHVHESLTYRVVTEGTEL